MTIHRTEAYFTSEGTIEVTIRMVDPPHDMTLRTNLTLSDATTLANQLTQAVRDYPHAQAELNARHPMR